MIDTTSKPTTEETDAHGQKKTSLTASERETIIRLSDADDLVYIDTTRRTDITALRKKDEATETGSGFHGTTEWATFTIPKARWATSRGIRGRGRRMSEAERLAAAERFRQYREGQEHTDE